MNFPSVTIITPTKNRPLFLLQCWRYVLRQTIEYKGEIEWLVLNNGKPLDFAPQTQSFRARVIEVGGCLGMVRNFGCQQAKGDIIVHFDDDDWQSPDRVQKQVESLCKTGVELVCSDDYYFLFPENEGAKARKSFSWGTDAYSSGGTFAYWKRITKNTFFPALQAGEDYAFATRVRQKNASSTKNLRDPTLCVVVRHKSNTSEFDEDVEGSSDLASWVRDFMGREDFEKTKELAANG